MQKHDKTGKNGFDIDPELLAHDLAILSVSKQNIDFNNEWQVYDAYVSTYNSFLVVINDKTRYD